MYATPHPHRRLAKKLSFPQNVPLRTDYERPLRLNNALKSSISYRENTDIYPSLRTKIQPLGLKGISCQNYVIWKSSIIHLASQMLL